MHKVTYMITAGSFQEHTVLDAAGPDVGIMKNIKECWTSVYKYVQACVHHTCTRPQINPLGLEYDLSIINRKKNYIMCQSILLNILQ